MYTVPRNALSRRVLPSVARTPRARGLSAAAALPSTKGLIVSEGSPGDARDGIEKRRSAFFPSLSRRTSSPVLRAVSRFSRRSAFSASLNGSTCLPPVRESWRAHGSVRRAKYSYTSVRCEATVAEEVPVEASTEKYEYQAEVSRLLDLIVHSLYSNKEVFLRELVSNASDALDKLRFLSVTDPDLMAANPNLEIRVKPNSKAGIITITDTGIGMTREELVDSLGTIAQSGTAKFLQAMKESKEGGASGDNNLIGKFGVGFYSAFLVADKVTVATKSAKSDKQFVWEGAANTNAYTIREETDPVKLIPRGTTITLHLKEDEKFEFGDTKRIQNLVKNYSQFISFPIYTWLEKSREKEVEGEGEEKEAEAEEEGAGKKTVTEKYWDWELANESKPIWLRSPKEVTKEEYNEFYKSTFKASVDPQAHSHFNVEGDIEFKGLLFIPGMAPYYTKNMWDGKKGDIRMYVKRVFISDQFDSDLFPRYLNFVKGVVDSNDLPLNVSREILQESRVVRLMKQRLVRKTFDMIDEISRRENKEDYKKFWTDFGRNLKMGCTDDADNHKRLAPLLRFNSSKSEDELTSLNEYVERMKSDQKVIYYLSADNIQSAKSAPFLEELVKRDLEVLYLIEPIDEVALTHMSNFKEKEFVDISKEGLELGDEDKEKDKEVSEEFKSLCDWMKGTLGDKVTKVEVSKRLSSSPCVLVSGKYGWSANMERIMKAQSFGDMPNSFDILKQRTLEINPNHLIIQALNSASKSERTGPQAKQILELLFETSKMASGYSPDNPAEFGRGVYEMMAAGLSGELKIAGVSSSGVVDVVEGVVVEEDYATQVPPPRSYPVKEANTAGQVPPPRKYAAEQAKPAGPAGQVPPPRKNSPPKKKFTPPQDGY